MPLDAIVSRLQNMPAFNVFAISPQDGSVAAWYEVTGKAVIPDLVINENDILEQVQTVAARIAHWGRLAAQAKRVWQIEERRYRRWRDSLVLGLLQDAEVSGAKKPTQDKLEASYRTHPDYDFYYAATERAEEAYSATVAILDGWRAKKDALRMAVFRRTEDGAAILSI